MILPHEIRSGVDMGRTVKWQIHSAGFLLFICFQLIGCNYFEKKSMYVTVNKQMRGVHCCPPRKACLLERFLFLLFFLKKIDFILQWICLF
jgi:hypothetical protein